MPSHQQSSVVIKRNRPLLLVGAAAMYLTQTGISDIIRWVRKGYYLSFQGAFSTVLCACYIAIFLFLGGCALIAGSRRLVLDPRGIQCDRVLFKRRLGWDQVCDWGISCDRQREITLLHLYFSPEPLPVRKKGGKKCSKQTIRIFLLERDWEQLRPTVLSYCEAHLSSQPFDGMKETDMGGGME